MTMDVEPAARKVESLQRCLNDLVSVLALPAMWSGRDATHVVSRLLDVLVRMLQLDLAYVRVSDSIEGCPIELVRSAEVRPVIRVDDLVGALSPWLTAAPPAARFVIPNPVGEGHVSIALFRLGLEDNVGVFVAGCYRPDFPTDIEQLLLQVAANQAAIGLQEARHSTQQRRLAEELDRRVAERTGQLVAVNEELRQAEARVRQDERELRLLVDFVPQLIGALGLDGRILHVNRAGLEYLGLALEELTQAEDHRVKMYHPDDLVGVRSAIRNALGRGTSCELEARIRRHDGQYRWFLFRFEPFRDELGCIVRWYGAGFDIEDRKRAEERMRDENLALREEVDKASMFEEIVGTSAPLRSILFHVAKVAPTDSTVLITGETGTGKELVARAIHKRSRRASRTFVSVNCAVIPTSLIASELFGHEKGAFTGALQRRAGRFELAEGGTIFLDEVGELPVETQVALLRVLQEREFERVGGSRPIRADVRVIAATNRNLTAAIAAGTFRADLFYRLNVFPVQMPSLRDRREDIPLLVRYFLDRYSRAAGKRIRSVSDTSLDLLQSYPWPGNIRELQNVIERSVIISETDVLSVDATWLHREPAPANPAERPLTDRLSVQEKTLIEAALAETKGQVSGQSGAAAKLKIPSTTLESKIKALGIDKNRFKTSH